MSFFGPTFPGSVVDIEAEDLFNWWVWRVEETQCDKCGKMTPCHTYQGHFICNVCGSITGFWIGVMFGAPARWTHFGNMEVVPHKMRGKKN